MASVFSRRVFAFVIDFFLISAFMWIISYLLSLIISPVDIYSTYAVIPYLLPVIQMVYFIVLEKSKGSTIGKSLMYLEVRSRNGANINWAQAIVRNLTKIYWVPIIFDWLIGRIMNTDRLFGSITRTVVTNMV